MFKGLKDYFTEVRAAHGGRAWHRNHWLWLYIAMGLQTGVVVMPHDWHFILHFGLAILAGLAWAFSGGLKYEAMMAETISYMAQNNMTAEEIAEALDAVDE